MLCQNELDRLAYALDELEGGADFQDAISPESIRLVVDFMRNVLLENRL